MADGYWRSLRRTRLSRRQVLAAASTGAAAAGVLAATRGGSTLRPERATATGLKRHGGRHQIGTAVPIDTLDPHTSIAGGVTYFPRIYNVLIAQSAMNPAFRFDDLAETLEQPDDSTWIFGMRPGVTIAPNDMGVPERDMDAVDAYESFERIKSLDFANGSVFVNEWFASHEASADGTRYTINTPGPYAWFLHRLGFFVNTIPPRELIAANTERLRTAGVGGGPFSASYTQEGERLTLNRNPNYYRTDPTNNDAQLPYIDGMDVPIISDRASRRTAFLSQQTYQYEAESQAEANELMATYDVYQPSVEPVQTFISVTMNVKRPPFDNPNIRKAVMHAINRQQYIDLVYGGDAQANGLVHWPQGAYALPPEELDELQSFNPELSRQLIQEAGFDLPLDITVMFPANSTIEEHSTHLPIFLEQMNQAGFRVLQDAQDFVTWLTNYSQTNYDCSLALNQVYETPEIPLDFQHSTGPARSNIFSNGLQDPTIDAEIDRVKTITDNDELIDAIHELQRDIYEAGPMFLPIVSPFSRTLYWNFVKNIPTGLGSAGLLLNDWWLGPDAPVPAVGLLGDVNCNGEVDAVDAALILQRDAGLVYALACDENADVNHDGRIDARDAALILQHNAGLLPELPS